MNTSFDIMYSVEIFDNDNIPTVTSIDSDIIYIGMCKFTPSDLLGFASVGRCLTYKGKILYPDMNTNYDESGEIFTAKFVDSKNFDIHKITVDESNLLKEYIYGSTVVYKEIYSDITGLSKYTPAEILNYYVNGFFITYKKSLVHINTVDSSDTTANTNSGSGSDSGTKGTLSDLDITIGSGLSTESSESENESSSTDTTNTINSVSGKFIDSNLSSYSIVINSDKTITVSKLSNGYKKFIELLSDNFEYSVKDLVTMLDNVILTYDNNILYIDRNLTNSNMIYGFYFGGLDMTEYMVTISSGGIKRKLYKKIIRQISIDGNEIGSSSYTISGNLDSLDYFVKNITNLTIEWNSGHFETWITIDSSAGDCAVNFPNGTEFIRDEKFDSIAGGHKRELSIKDGIVVSAPVGEEWMDF